MTTKELFGVIQSALKQNDSAQSYRGLLNQAEKDFNVIEYSTDKRLLWTVGLDPLPLPTLESPAIRVQTIKDLANRLEKSTSINTTFMKPFESHASSASFAATSAAAPFSFPVLRETQQNSFLPSSASVMTSSAALPSTFGRVKDMLSVWSGHLSSYKEKAFRGNTPMKNPPESQSHSSSGACKLEFVDAVELPNDNSIKTPVKPTGPLPLKTPLSCDVTPVIVGRRSCIFPDNKRPRLLAIPPLREEDNYELSDKDTDSEQDEDEMDRKRELKKIPEWTHAWREKCMTQSTVDPESIFGIFVPAFEMSLVFNERNYAKMKIDRPKRIRGSSGNWRLDKLKQEEIDEYRRRLGQVIKAEGVFVN